MQINPDLVPGTIVDSGSNTNGDYIKFSDGTMICYREISQNINIDNSWGSLYYGADTTSYNFAQTFSTAPKVIVGLRPSASVGCWLVFQDSVSITTSSYSGLYVARPNSANSVGVVFTILAIGKWK